MTVRMHNGSGLNGAIRIPRNGMKAPKNSTIETAIKRALSVSCFVCSRPTAQALGNVMEGVVEDGSGARNGETISRANDDIPIELQVGAVGVQRGWVGALESVVANDQPIAIVEVDRSAPLVRDERTSHDVVLQDSIILIGVVRDEAEFVPAV